MDYSVKEEKHTQTGKTLWVLRFPEKPANQKEIFQQLKQIGYVKWNKIFNGYVFYNDDPREKLKEILGEPKQTELDNFPIEVEVKLSDNKSYYIITTKPYQMSYDTFIDLGTSDNKVSVSNYDYKTNEGKFLSDTLDDVEKWANVNKDRVKIKYSLNENLRIPKDKKHLLKEYQEEQNQVEEILKKVVITDDSEGKIYELDTNSWSSLNNKFLADYTILDETEIIVNLTDSINFDYVKEKPFKTIGEAEIYIDNYFRENIKRYLKDFPKETPDPKPKAKKELITQTEMFDKLNDILQKDLGVNRYLWVDDLSKGNTDFKTFLIEPDSSFNERKFAGMQILYEDGIYEVSEHNAGENKDELYIFKETKSPKVAIKSLLKGNYPDGNQIPIKVLDNDSSHDEVYKSWAEYKKGKKRTVKTKTNMQIAEIILENLGGKDNLVKMTGAKNFVAIDNGIMFSIPKPQNLKINKIRIVLRADNYDIEFGYVRGADYTVFKELEGVGAESLKSVFEDTTGLNLVLFSEPKVLVDFKFEDFSFYGENDNYSFLHIPTGIEADIITIEQGSRGSGEDLKEVDYLEFTNNEPNEETADKLEEFISENLFEIEQTVSKEKENKQKPIIETPNISETPITSETPEIKKGDVVQIKRRFSLSEEEHQMRFRVITDKDSMNRVDIVEIESKEQFPPVETVSINHLILSSYVKRGDYVFFDKKEDAKLFIEKLNQQAGENKYKFRFYDKSDLTVYVLPKIGYYILNEYRQFVKEGDLPKDINIKPSKPKNVYNQDWLFIGKYPTGTMYSDKTVNENGDYKEIAYVFDDFQTELKNNELYKYKLKVYSDDEKYKEIVNDLEKQFGKRYEKQEDTRKSYKAMSYFVEVAVKDLKNANDFQELRQIFQDIKDEYLVKLSEENVSYFDLNNKQKNEINGVFVELSENFLKIKFKEKIKDYSQKQLDKLTEFKNSLKKYGFEVKDINSVIYKGFLITTEGELEDNRTEPLSNYEEEYQNKYIDQILMNLKNNSFESGFKYINWTSDESLFFLKKNKFKKQPDFIVKSINYKGEEVEETHNVWCNGESVISHRGSGGYSSLFSSKPIKGLELVKKIMNGGVDYVKDVDVFFDGLNGFGVENGRKVLKICLDESIENDEKLISEIESQIQRNKEIFDSANPDQFERKKVHATKIYNEYLKMVSVDNLRKLLIDYAEEMEFINSKQGVENIIQNTYINDIDETYTYDQVYEMVSSFFEDKFTSKYDEQAKIDPMLEMLETPKEEKPKEILSDSETKKIEIKDYIGYNFESQRELNDAIIKFLKQKGNEDYSLDEKKFIAQYTGIGGLIKKDEEFTKEAFSEFYTPDLVVKKMWLLANQYGFSGGKVLEPSVGIGNFLKYVDFLNCKVTGYEINENSAKIVKILFPEIDLKVESFANHFYGKSKYDSQLEDKYFEKDFDLVIGNPPYGKSEHERKIVSEKKLLKVRGTMQLEHYFMIRGLDVLKSGGLLVYITSNNLFFKGYSGVKKIISQKAELVDAYLLPQGTFETTSVGTAIIVLRKK